MAEKEKKMTFKEKLAILRKNKGLTQDEFAKQVGVSRQAVYKWENGTSYPEVPKLLEIKALFDISLDDLFDDSFEVAVPDKKKRRAAKKEAAAKKEGASENIAEEVKTPVIEKVEEKKDEPAVINETKIAPKKEEIKKVEEDDFDDDEFDDEPIKSPVKDEQMTTVTYDDEPEGEKVESQLPWERKVGFFERIFGRK